MELLSLESQTLTDGFRRKIDSAVRRIRTLIAKSGRQPLDVDIIQERLSFENSMYSDKYSFRRHPYLISD